MARPTKSGERQGETMSFRFTESKTIAFKKMLEENNLNLADYVSETLQAREKQVTIIAAPRMSPQDRAAHYRHAAAKNRLGNNVNQIAHRLNSDYLAGKISPQTYDGLLYQLELLNAFAEGIK